MKIITKYDIGDTVYSIAKGNWGEFAVCETCGGTGFVTISNTDRQLTCPDCMGMKGIRKYNKDVWEVHTYLMGDVNRISIEIYGKKRRPPKRVIYFVAQNEDEDDSAMVLEEFLFPSMETAQAECDRRNAQNNNTDEKI